MAPGTEGGSKQRAAGRAHSRGPHCAGACVPGTALAPGHCALPDPRFVLLWERAAMRAALCALRSEPHPRLLGCPALPSPRCTVARARRSAMEWGAHHIEERVLAELMRLGVARREGRAEGCGRSHWLRKCEFRSRWLSVGLRAGGEARSGSRRVAPGKPAQAGARHRLRVPMSAWRARARVGAGARGWEAAWGWSLSPEACGAQLRDRKATTMQSGIKNVISLHENSSRLAGQAAVK